MRLPTLIALLLVAPAVASQVEQPPEPCPCDWRALFEPEPGVLYDMPEFQPTPISGEVFDLIPALRSAQDYKAVSVVRFVVDTLGVATDVRVVCAPSEAISKRAGGLVSAAVFSPARQRGRPVVLPMMVPVLIAKDE